MNGTKVAKPKYSKNVGEGVDTTAQAAGIIAGRYTQIKSGCIKPNSRMYPFSEKLLLSFLALLGRARGAARKLRITI